MKMNYINGANKKDSASSDHLSENARVPVQNIFYAMLAVLLDGQNNSMDVYDCTERGG